MSNTEQQLLSFVNKAQVLRSTDSKTTLDYVDINNIKRPFSFVSISTLRLNAILYIFKVFGYVIKDTDRKDLYKVLTKRNQGVIMSLNQRFKSESMRIIKIQKFNKKNELTYYRLFILVDDEFGYKGLECNIL